MKFKVTLSYHGSATLEVEAENESLARDEARTQLDKMSNTDFLETIDLMEESCDIEDANS